MLTTKRIKGSGRYLRGGSGVVAIVGLVLTGLAVSACGSSSATPSSSSTPGVINAIGAENEYANVLSQIGGKYVHVSSILNNPNTDPHTFESSPERGAGGQRGPADRAERRGLRHLHEHDRVGVAECESQGHRRPGRPRVCPTDTPNPHLWYDPKTMPAVAKVMAKDLSELQPSHAAYFQSNLTRPSTRRWSRCTPPSRRSRPSTPARPWRRRSRWPTTCSRPWGSTTSPRSVSRPTS